MGVAAVMNDALYRAERDVITLRAQLFAAEDNLQAYVRGDGTDLEVFERLDREIERARDLLDAAEERETQLRWEEL